MALKAHPTLGKSADCLRQHLVLLLEDARTQRGDIVVVVYLDGALQEYGPAVEVVGHHVHRAAADFYPVFECLLDGVQGAAEGGQQRRVRIQHPPGVGRDELGYQDFVETGQHHESNVCVTHGFEQTQLPLGAPRDITTIDEAHRHTRRLSACPRGRVGAIAPNQHNLGRKLRLSGSVQQRLEVGPVA
jgi:hypothetical protein